MLQANQEMHGSGSMDPIQVPRPNFGQSTVDAIKAAQLKSPRRVKVSPEKIRANRRNAKKGGPKTAAGKARSSRNAIKHGVFSQYLINLPGYSENLEEYLKLVKGIISEMKPSTTQGMNVVKQIAYTYLQLERLAKHEKATIEYDLLDALRDIRHVDDAEGALLASNVMVPNLLKQVKSIADAVEVVGKDMSEGKPIVSLPRNELFDLMLLVVTVTKDQEVTALFEKKYGEGETFDEAILKIPPTELFNKLNKLAECQGKKTQDLINGSLDLSTTLKQKALKPQLALLPSPERMQLIVRYRTELYRTIGWLLKLFEEVEKYGQIEIEDGVVDAAFVEDAINRG